MINLIDSIVMISGSRSVNKLPQSALNSLDKIIELGFKVVIGDCYGIDTLVQEYLKLKNYQKVTIYHIGNKPRNNLVQVMLLNQLLLFLRYSQSEPLKR